MRLHVVPMLDQPGVVGGRIMHDYDCSPATFAELLKAEVAMHDEDPCMVERRARDYARVRNSDRSARGLKRRPHHALKAYPCPVCAKPIGTDEMVAIVPLSG